jgi:hypothetical protein
VDKMHKVTVTAPLHTEAAALASVASILSLPPESERQPDLQYLTAIFVSSGMNKNGAVFMGSELIKARGSITSKAVDVEHEEQSIIGQITGNAFLARDRTIIDAETAATDMSTEELDELEMDIGITAIIHKSRFPELAKEIEEGQWMVSMEAYYRDYDIKVGGEIISRDKAEEMGYDKLIGTVVQLKDGDKEMGFHLVGRVLRDIVFAGVGIVQNPANPRSVIMEAAAINDYIAEEVSKGSKTVMDLSSTAAATTVEKTSTDVTREFIKQAITEAVETAIEAKLPKQEEALLNNQVLPGTCVSYARTVYTYPEDTLADDPATDLSQYPLYTQPGDDASPGPGAEVAREHYCKLFDLDCAARPGDATLPACWRNVFAATLKEEFSSHDNEIQKSRRIKQGMVSLQSLINDAKKFVI